MTTTTRLSQKTTAALQNFDFRLSQLNERANAIGMNKLPEIVEEVDTGVATLLNGMDANDEGEFILRELRGLDKTMQTYRGELVNNMGKLTEIDKNISSEETRLKGLAEDNADRPAIERNLRDMRSERDARLEDTAATSSSLRSQISRIKETIDRILNGDTTLAQKIKTLFREQGLTILAFLQPLV